MNIFLLRCFLMKTYRRFYLQPLSAIVLSIRVDKNNAFFDLTALSLSQYKLNIANDKFSLFTKVIRKSHLQM